MDWANGVASDGTGITVVGTTGGSLHGPYRGGYDAYIRRYDLDGGLVWGRQFGSTGFDHAGDVAAGADGIAVVGEIDQHGYVRLYDRAGHLIWSRSLAGPGPTAVAISGRSIYIMGRARDSEHHLLDVYARRYRFDGSTVWTRYARGIEDEFPCCVAADASGVTIAWAARGGWEAPIPTWDVAIRRYDPDGRHLWTRRLGDGPGGERMEGAGGIAADAYGITVVGPSTREGADNDPAARIWRYRRDGRQEWVRTYRGPYGGRAYAVDADGTGISVVGELYRGPSEDDPRSGFLRRYSFSGEAQWTEHLPTKGYSHVEDVAAGGGADVIAGSIRVYVDGEYGSDWDGWVRRYLR